MSVCDFAADLMICAPNAGELQENLNIWEHKLRKRNIKINTSKTKVMRMTIGKEENNIKITLNQQEIEQADSFKYLGVAIDRDGNVES